LNRCGAWQYIVALHGFPSHSATPDVFLVAQEAIGGSFRLFFVQKENGFVAATNCFAAGPSGDISALPPWSCHIFDAIRPRLGVSP